jgi:hypothetical protein
MITRYQAQISTADSPRSYRGIALVDDLMAEYYQVEIAGKPGRTYTLPRALVTLGAFEGADYEATPTETGVRRLGQRRWSLERHRIGG